MSMFLGMENKDVIMTASVIVGPILAVQIQKILEQFREKKEIAYIFSELLCQHGPKNYTETMFKLST